MPRIDLTIRIQAPPELCFDLARDLDFHQHSLAHTGERIVAGRRSGRIELGEEVTWEARHFGIRHRHTARIVQFERPWHFRDAMTAGRFARFVHDHSFAKDSSGAGDATLMRDVIEFASPLGPLGAIVDRLLLQGHLARLIETRNEALRRHAEARHAEALAAKQSGR